MKRKNERHLKNNKTRRCGINKKKEKGRMKNYGVPSGRIEISVSAFNCSEGNSKHSGACNRAEGML